MKKNIAIAVIIFTSVLVSAGAFFAYQKFLKKENSVKKEEAAEKNYFEINDELAGVSFKIGKKFDRMPAQALQTKNPNFVYGFLAKDDAKISCFISQTKRENAGAISVGQLRDGVFEQLKKSNPDAKLDEAKVIDIGENDNKGAKLKMSFVENGKVPMFQWETVGITGKFATFAFCVCPKAVIDLYQDDFNLFLDSVRIK